MALSWFDILSDTASKYLLASSTFFPSWLRKSISSPFRPFSTSFTFISSLLCVSKDRSIVVIKSLTALFWFDIPLKAARMTTATAIILVKLRFFLNLSLVMVSNFTLSSKWFSRAWTLSSKRFWSACNLSSKWFWRACTLSSNWFWTACALSTTSSWRFLTSSLVSFNLQLFKWRWYLISPSRCDSSTSLWIWN